MSDNFLEQYYGTVGKENIDLAYECTEKGALNRMEILDLSRLLKTEKIQMLHKAESFRGHDYNVFDELSYGAVRKFTAASYVISSHEIWWYLTRRRNISSLGGASAFGDAVLKILKKAQKERDEDAFLLDESLIRVASDPTALKIYITKKHLGKVLEFDDPLPRIQTLLCKKIFYTDEASPIKEIESPASGKVIEVYSPYDISSRYSGCNANIAKAVLEAAEKYGIEDAKEEAICQKNLYSCVGSIYRSSLDDKEYYTDLFLKAVFTGVVTKPLDASGFMEADSEGRFNEILKGEE